MSTDATRPEEPTPSETAPDETPQRSRLRRTLSPPNPFYLGSAAFILHSTGLGLHGQGDLPPLVLMGLVGGYVLLMAMIAFGIVRLWNVWDDARSILLVVMLLFVELALAADQPLMEDRSTGLIMLFGGLAIAIAVTEIILRGLRMKLPLGYRGPLYLLWGLLFLYPLVLIGPIDVKDFGRLPWLLLLFPILAGGGLLTLLPAVRQGRAAIVENGTPWRWPLYPWTIFVFLGLCLLFRSYALCLSFDPALALSFEEAWDLQSIYGPYFVTPILFALAWLVMEAGIVRKHRLTQFVGLMVPVACIGLALPGLGGNAAYATFVKDLVNSIGSPAWLMLIASGIFYVTAALRHVQWAWRFALMCLVGLSVIGPQTLDLRSVPTLASWPLFAASILAVGVGLRRGRSRLIWEGAAYAILGSVVAGGLENDLFSTPKTVYYLLSATALVIGGLTRDRGGRRLRQFGAFAIVLAAAEMCVRSTVVHEPVWLPFAFLGLCCTLPLAIGWWREDRFVGTAAAINGIQWYAGGLLQVFVMMIETYRWSGWPSFACGIALLHLGLIVSGVKGGAHRRLIARYFAPLAEPTS